MNHGNPGGNGEVKLDPAATSVNITGNASILTHLQILKARIEQGTADEEERIKCHRKKTKSGLLKKLFRIPR